MGEGTTNPSRGTPFASRAIAVLGMHRSGTSITTRVLNLLGAYLGEDAEMLPPFPDNPEGYWERSDIVQIHDRILLAVDTAWDTSFPLPDGWHRSAEVSPLRAELQDLVRSIFIHHPLWAWKDPRTALLLPLWQDLLGELGVGLRCLLVTRHPLDVAKSLEKRDGFPIAEGVSIWFNYNLAMIENTRDVPRAVVSYDQLVGDWRSALSESAGVLDLPLSDAGEDICESIDKAVRRDLRHSASTSEDLVRAGCPAAVRKLAEIVSGLSRNEGVAPSTQRHLKKLIRDHAAAGELYRHDILRALRKARSLERHAAGMEHLRSAEHQETARLADESKALNSEVQRLAVVNVALNEEAARLRGALEEKDSRLGDAEARIQELTQASTEAQSLGERKDQQLLEQGEELEELHQRQAEQRREISLLRGFADKRTDEVRTLRADIAKHEESLRQALAHAKTLAGALDDVYASQSWRITQPLRAVYTTLRSLGPGGTES